MADIDDNFNFSRQLRLYRRHSTHDQQLAAFHRNALLNIISCQISFSISIWLLIALATFKINYTLVLISLEIEMIIMLVN